jgi:hypothetical protein
MAVATHKYGCARTSFCLADMAYFENAKLDILFRIQCELGVENVISSVNFIQISKEHFALINYKDGHE